MKRFIAASLCIIMLLLATACGSTETEKTDSTTATTIAQTEEVTTAEQGYKYFEEKNYLDASGNPAEIVILNFASYVNANISFVPEEDNGDVISKAMEKRNELVEEKLGVNITEDRRSYADLGGWGTAQAALGTLVINAVSSGDKIWDIANLFPSWNASLITNGALLDLNSVEGLHLTESYWDQGVMEDLTIKGKCYTGCSNLTLMPIDLTWALFFNETIMTDLKLDLPYTLVENKEWTLDTLLQYVKAAEAMNGTQNYDYEKDNTTTCGIAAHTDATSAMVIAANNLLITKNSEGTYDVNLSSDRIVDTIEKITEIFAASKGHSQLKVSTPNNSSQPYGYCNMFEADRAMFLTAEIKASNDLREMNSNWGVLPFPLYDKNQENYISTMSNTAFLTMPAVQKDVERAAKVLDALSYYSTDVKDTYVEIVVTHKNLQNINAAKMMNLIRSNMTIEVGTFYEFTSSYLSDLRNGIRNENVNPASLAASQEKIIQKRIDDFFSAIE